MLSTNQQQTLWINRQFLQLTLEFLNKTWEKVNRKNYMIFFIVNILTNYLLNLVNQVNNSNIIHFQVRPMKPIQESIKVMARIRPPSNGIVYRDDKNTNLLHCGGKDHILDHIFVAQDTNQDIFQKVGYDLVGNTLEGYNSTLFVYGHTGSGKTFTINGSNSQQGLITKTLRLLIKMTQNSEKYEYFSLKMSYFEIYNEEVKDLLGSNKITVRQKVEKGFYLQGLQQSMVDSVDEFLKIYKKGMHNRKTDTTKMNSDSSRSHAILTFYVETKQKINGSIICPTSKLNFVDLAGSERLRQTQAVGDRKSEAAKINTSLSILKRVINMLSNTKNKDMVGIPYRESVLTMILKDSLGGNSHTIIIGTIHNNLKNPSNTNDMLATLEFLERAKKVKNEKKINQKLQGNQQRLQYKISQYQKEIASYRQQIEELNAKLVESNQSKQVYFQQIKDLKEKIVNQTPTFQFLETSQSFFEHSFENAISFKDGLPTIQQEQNLSFKSAKCLNEPMTFQNTQNSQGQSMIEFPQGWDKTSKKSHQSQSQRRVSQKISDLQQKIQNMSKYQAEQQNILKLATKNMQKMDFSEAQLNILQAQHKRIQFLQKQLKRSQIYIQGLVAQFQSEKNKIIKKYEELNTISERNNMVLASRKSQTTVLRLKEQIQQIEQQKRQIREQSKIELLKMQLRLTEILKENESLGKKKQDLENNYEKLLQSFQDLQNRQKQMDMILQEQRSLIMNGDVTEQIIKAMNLYKDQQQTNSLNTQIMQLSNANEKLTEEKLQFQLYLRQIKGELQQKDKQIEQLKEEVQAAQQRLNTFQQQTVTLDEYMEIKNALMQIKGQLQEKKQVLDNFKDILKIDVNEHQITIAQLLAQFHAKSQRVHDLQVINANYQLKELELVGNLQFQKCRYNQFMKLYNQRMNQQGKIIAEKDLQIEELSQAIKRLQEQIYMKQKQYEMQSQAFRSSKNSNESQMEQICNNFFKLEKQYNLLKEQNENLKNKLQELQKQQSQSINSREYTNLRLLQDNQKLRRKYDALKVQLAKYKQWTQRQLDQYMNILMVKKSTIEKLQKENVNLSTQIKKYKQNNFQQKEVDLKKVMQENYMKQKRIHQLQDRMKEMIIQQEEETEINRQYKIQIQELSEELFQLRCSYEDQRKIHLKEITQLRSQNINKNLMSAKEKLALLVKKKHDKSNLDADF